MTTSADIQKIDFHNQDIVILYDAICIHRILYEMRDMRCFTSIKSLMKNIFPVVRDDVK